MAIEKEVNVIISASDRFSDAVGAFAGSMGTIGTVVGALITTFAAAGAAATAFAFKLGSTVVEEAADFQNAIITVGAVSMSAGTSLEDVEDILHDLTNQFPVTGFQAGQAMETIAQLGFGAKDSLEAVTEASLNLMIATGTDLNTAANTLTSTMNAFGIEVDDLNHLMDVFVEAHNNSAASVDKLAVALPYVGSTMKLFGISTETTVSALSILIANGLDASTAATSLNQAMLALVKETNKGSAALATMGLTYDDISPRTHSFQEILNTLHGRLTDAGTAQKIFNTRGMRSITILAENADKVGGFTGQLEGAHGAIDAVSLKLQAWENVTANLGGSLSLLGDVIGRDLLESIIDVIGVSAEEGLRGIVTAITELEKESGRIGGPLVSIFESLRDAIQEVFGEQFGGDIETFYNFLGDTMDTVALLSTTFLQFGVQGGAVLLEFVKSTNQWSQNTDAVVTAIKAVNSVIGGLSLAMAVIYDAGQLILYGWQSIGTAISAASAWIMEEFYTGLLKAAELVDYLPFVDMEGEIAHLRDTTKQMVDEQDRLWADLPERPAMLSDNVAAAIINIDDYADSIRTAGTSTKVAGEEIEEAATGVIRFTGSTQDVIDALDALDEKQGVTAEGASELADRFKVVGGRAYDVVEQADAYADALDRNTAATGMWVDLLDAEGNILKSSWQEFDKVTESTDKSAESTKGMGKEVDDLQRKLSQEMELKIMDSAARVKIVEIKTEAESMVEIFKFKAEVDIAQIEAAAQIATAQWDAMAANASVVEASINKIAEIAEISPLSAWKIAAAAADIARSQVDLVKSQREYVDAQTKILDLQARAIERGEGAVINVEIAGDSSTWLAGLLNDLLEQILIKASMEAFTCLCGTPTV